MKAEKPVTVVWISPMVDGTSGQPEHARCWRNQAASRSAH